MNSLKELVKKSRDNVRISVEEDKAPITRSLDREFGSTPQFDPSTTTPRDNSDGWNGKITGAMLKSISIDSESPEFNEDSYPLKRREYWDKTPRTKSSIITLGTEFFRKIL